MSNENHSPAQRQRSFMTKSYRRFLRSSSTTSSPVPPLEDDAGPTNVIAEADTKDKRVHDKAVIDVTDSLASVTELIQRVRETCLSRGDNGIFELGIMFRHLDIDYNKRISLAELKEKLKEYGLQCTEEELRLLFRTLDKDGSGGIDFIELMEALRPPMKQCRIDVISEAFDLVDTGRNGTIDLDEIREIPSGNATANYIENMKLKSLVAPAFPVETSCTNISSRDSCTNISSRD
ncbi:hypothetical protein Btru_035735 [Bulinus truncatus]|nr:hypothetical protein Btru_035735 [Bulinus truncatus]